MSMTRRQFLERLGQASIALVGVRFLSGCEELDFESKLVGGLLPFMTPAADGSWYWQSGNGISKSDAPAIDADDWELEIRDDSQLLETVSFADLESYANDGEALTYWKTMRCVFGANVGAVTSTLVANGIFSGVPLYRVLEDAGVSGSAVKLRTFGADGFRSNIPMERALEQGPSPLAPLLAYELNGEPLSRLRGGPVRLVIPEMWGYKNVKWLDQLVATEDDAIFGTYEDERFDPQSTPTSPQTQQIIDDPGEISLGSIITEPGTFSAEIEGPEVTIAGASFVGGRPIEAVEVSLDEGPFEPAQLTGHQEMLDSLDEGVRDVAGGAVQDSQDWPWPNVWITWHKTFSELSRGTHTISIRASDTSGRRQEAQSERPLVIAPQVKISFRVI